MRLCGDFNYSSDRSRRPARGFNLTEMMVVVAMMGVLAALALPDIKELTLAATEPKDVVALRGFLAEARGAARRVNRCVVVTRVNTRQLTWALFQNNTPACPNGTLHAIGGTFNLRSSGLRLDPFLNATNANTILFRRSGGTGYASFATVPLARIRDGAITFVRHLQIMPGTGSVKGSL